MLCAVAVQAQAARTMARMVNLSVFMWFVEFEWLFALGPLGQSLFSENRGDVVNMQAIAHTRAGVVCQWRDAAIAIIVSGHRRMKDAEGDDFAAFQLYDFVTILCFSAISIMHN